LLTAAEKSSPPDVQTQDRDDSSVEFEVKLAGPGRKIEKAARAAKAMGARRQRIDSTYFDTPDRQLRSAGCSFRLRRKGDRWELTLKRGNRGAIGRGEWTAILDALVPDVDLLPANAPLAEIGLAPGVDLAPVFTTKIERLKYVAEISGAVAEVAIDSGDILAGGRSSPVEEIELELKAGSDAGLIAQARGMAEAYGLWVSPLTKADRGYALADGRPPVWVKATQPTLCPTMTVGDALSYIVAGAGDQIHGNLEAARDGRDPEGVHQLRVSLRRLRSAVEMFHEPIHSVGPSWRRDAGDTLKTLGGARDLDVFLTETLPAVAMGDEPIKGFDALRSAAEKARGEAYDSVRKALRRRRFNRLLLDVAWVGAGGATFGDARPISDAAAMLLGARLEAVLARGEGFEALDAAGRHRVRIAVKKLRYAVDFFECLFPDAAARAYLKALRRLQEDLGALNDAAVATTLSKRLAEDASKGASAANAVAAWSKERLAAADSQIVRHWRDFAATDPFWTAR